MKIGKRLKESYKSFENSKYFSIEEAVKLIKSNSKAKFDETIDISMNLGVDPRQSDQMVRGMVALPSGTGKDVRVAVFAKK
jgi:large subunit ribosomal protein L1